MKYYHYTTVWALRGIATEAVIKLASFAIGAGEKPAIWFSTNQDWEQTARKSVGDSLTGKETGPLSRDELLAKGIPCIRIEVNSNCINLISWQEHKESGGISRASANCLEKAAKRWRANPDEWWLCYKPIPWNEFTIISVEKWNGEIWEPQRWENLKPPE